MRLIRNNGAERMSRSGVVWGMAKELTHGPLGPGAVHLCVDMQKLFACDTPWHTPWMERVLPVVTRIAAHRPARTVFTRFIPPRRARDMTGSWRRYYERWRDMTGERLDPELLNLVEPLAALVPPARMVDKQVYSPFSTPALTRLLRGLEADCLIITGAETDVCVLAAVLGAVDRGYRVILPVDALCSSSDQTHDALMTLYRTRFGQQIETTDSDTLLRLWR